jgi:ADP-dependent phosphofructokinase/glucokinase
MNKVTIDPIVRKVDVQQIFNKVDVEVIRIHTDYFYIFPTQLSPENKEV